MKSFLRIVAMMGASLVVAALVAYPAWRLVGLVSVEPIHRVMQRVAMLAALIGLVWLLRRQHLGNREALGYTLPRRRFVRQMFVAFGCGVVLMLPLVALLFALDIRALKPEFGWDPVALLGIVLQGLVTGFAVAFIEETFFRGAMQSVMTREGAPRLALVLPSLVYASVHFLGGRLRIPAEQVDWGSGMAVLASLFERYRDPLALADSFIALFAVGLLLALVRRHTGAIAACIGLHAGWVCVITSMRSASLVQPDSPWSWLVGSYDGVIGWGALALIALIIAGYVTMTRRSRPAPAGSVVR